MTVSAASVGRCGSSHARARGSCVREWECECDECDECDECECDAHDDERDDDDDVVQPWRAPRRSRRLPTTRRGDDATGVGAPIVGDGDEE